MINMTHRPHIQMGLRPLKLLTCHRGSPEMQSGIGFWVAAVGLEPTTSRL
jgi:hypothetical protein